MSWLRRLARWRHLLDRHRGRHARSHWDLFSDAIPLLPRTPPPPPLDLEPWPPRITRWVRLACPQPDDTIIIGIQPWAY